MDDEKKEVTSEENKEEVKDSDKKGKKEKAGKKKVVPFNEIDVTTASEDDIIQSGLRYHTKADYFCYMLMAAIAVFAILPVALRFFIPRPITEIEKEVVYLDISCYRTIGRDGYELSSKVNIHYRDGEIQQAELSFDSFKVSNDADPDYVFAEINEFNSINEDGFEAKHSGNNYSYVIDFKSNKELSKNEYLQHYSYFSGPEIDYLKSINYRCDSEPKTKLELVRVDTNEKIKSLEDDEEEK